MGLPNVHQAHRTYFPRVLEVSSKLAYPELERILLGMIVLANAKARKIHQDVHRGFVLVIMSSIWRKLYKLVFTTHITGLLTLRIEILEGRLPSSMDWLSNNHIGVDHHRNFSEIFLRQPVRFGQY